MKRWILVLLAAMMTMLQTGAFAESDDEFLGLYPAGTHH